MISSHFIYDFLRIDDVNIMFFSLPASLVTSPTLRLSFLSSKFLFLSHYTLLSHSPYYRALSLSDAKTTELGPKLLLILVASGTALISTRHSFLGPFVRLLMLGVADWACI
jgi:hypothetical protein